MATTSSASGASSSFSSVVSNLVRAQMGASIPSTVTDDDLDRQIGELIVKEAKKKMQKYSETGIRAYLRNQPDSNAPRTNKRFLSSIIRSTDDHNKTVLRAQALAAEEIKRARAEEERKQRTARAEEAVQARRKAEKAASSFSSRRRHDDSSEEEGWDRWDGRTAERKRKTRDWENWDGKDEDEPEDEKERERRKRRHRSRSRERKKERSGRSSRRTKHDKSRSRSPRKERSGRRTARHSRSRSPSVRDDGKRTSRKHRSRRRSRSRTHSRSPAASCKPSPKYALDDGFDDDRPSRSLPSSPRRSPSPAPLAQDDKPVNRETELCQRQPEDPSSSESSRVQKPRSRSHARSSSPKRHQPSPKPAKKRSPTRSPSRSPPPGPNPALQPPSKMDKYFEESYDPRLDVAPLTMPQVPATGLINDAEYDGWDTMLELIRVRREDKEEKKRMERLGLTKEKVKEKKKAMEGGESGAANRWNGEGVSVMDIEYKKRGSVREWDLGKAGF